MRTIQPKQLSVAAFQGFGQALLKPDRPADIENPSLVYWHDMVDLSNLGSLGTMGFMRMKRQGIACTTLQALPNSDELYLSLDGKPSVFFVAPDRGGGMTAPDEGRLEAFVIEGGSGVLVEKGVWHVAPFPLTEFADFALALHNTVIVRKDGGFTVDAGEISYKTLHEAVTIIL